MCIVTTVYTCDCAEYNRTSSCASGHAPGVQRRPCSTHAASDSFGIQVHRRLRWDCAAHGLRVRCYCGHTTPITRAWMLFNYSEPPRFHALVCPDCIGNFDGTPFSVRLSDGAGLVPASMVVDGRLCYIKS